MTFEFAIQRLHDLESKQDVIINRKMIDNFLDSLRKGLDKNREDFLV